MNLETKLAVYISRYAPSRRKLIAYISRKTYAVIPEELLEKLGYDEELMLDMWIRGFIAEGRGVQVIQQKLLLKQFEKDGIERALMRHEDEIYDWSLYERKIQDKIIQLQGKGKAKRMIAQHLFRAYPYFRAAIESLLMEDEDTENLKKEFTKTSSRYNMYDPRERQKCIASLLRKGFKYGDIKDIIRKGTSE